MQMHENLRENKTRAKITETSRPPERRAFFLHAQRRIKLNAETIMSGTVWCKAACICGRTNIHRILCVPERATEKNIYLILFSSSRGYSLVFFYCLHPSEISKDSYAFVFPDWFLPSLFKHGLMIYSVGCES